MTGLKKDGTTAMHRTLMLYVNESGFYALNEKYSAENLLVNMLATAKRGSKVLGSLRRMELHQTPMVISSLSRICVMPFSDTPSFEDRYASFFLSSVGYHHAESEHIFFEVLLVDGIVLEQGTVVVYGLWRIRQDAGYLGTFGDA